MPPIECPMSTTRPGGNELLEHRVRGRRRADRSCAWSESLRCDLPWLRRSKLTIADPLAELVDEGAALEEQVVAVLAEPVDQHDGHRRVERAVLLVVELHAVARAHEAGAVGDGRCVNPSSAAMPVRRTLRTRRSAMTAAAGRGGREHAGDDAALHDAAAPAIGARHARADPRHDLVVDRADRIGPVLRARFAAASRPEQHGLVALGDRQVADVHDELVHAHPAADREALPVDRDRADVGRVPRDPVGVAERDERERGVAGRWCTRARTRRPRRRGPA